MAAMMDPNATLEHPYMVFSMSANNTEYATEPQVAYPTLVAFSNHQHVLDENCARAQEAGCTVYFGHFGEQLIVEDSRVTGIYARNAETGKYKKIVSKNGVVMATGGCEGNKDITRVFYPAMEEYSNLSCWPNFDIEGNPTNTGDGYRMGAWAGAAFSTFMAPMCHVMDGPFYASRMGIGLCLTMMGGLYSDKEARVYDNDKHVIPGLYAAGNIQGNRFAVKYPFKLSGASRAMAMFYGHVAGENIAAGK